jgi:hypothetical protein
LFDCGAVSEAESFDCVVALTSLFKPRQQRSSGIFSINLTLSHQVEINQAFS